MAAKTTRGSDPDLIADTELARTAPSLAELGEFTALVALLAILSDAAIGHALQWENDPYWTYWITKTFLIATVFGLGTAWFGIGAKQGAAITAVHTVVLTVYYWSLSPIGLPSHPNWLDLEHTWVTGVPIHFAVIYLGYLTALWLWRRRANVNEAVDVARDALTALVGGLVIVAVSGLGEALAIGQFQGVTWYVVRLLITVPFILAWTGIAGRDTRAAVGGAIVLTSVLMTYSHFLGPVGLPDLPLRIFESESPGATVQWLTYRQEFLIAMPITLAAALAVFVLLSRRSMPMRLAALPGLRAAGVVALVLSVAGAVIATVWVDPDGDPASVSASGDVGVETGEWFSGDMDQAAGSLTLRTLERNPRVTPLRPHDVVELTAEVVSSSRITVEATHPMVEDPLGRFGTWWGVGYHVWHHGRSGIGSSRIPAVQSDVAVFALGTVAVDGQVVAAGVPVHAMTMPDGTLELDVGQPEIPIPGLPHEHLRAVWTTYEGGSSQTGRNARYAYGGLVLAGLLLLAGAAVRAQSGA